MYLTKCWQWTDPMSHANCETSLPLETAGKGQVTFSVHLATEVCPAKFYYAHNRQCTLSLHLLGVAVGLPIAFVAKNLSGHDFTAKPRTA